MMNDARLRLPEYDKPYEASRKLPDGPERNALYAKMTDIMVAYGVWEVGPSRYSNWLDAAVAEGLQAAPVPRSTTGSTTTSIRDWLARDDRLHRRLVDHQLENVRPA